MLRKLYRKISRYETRYFDLSRVNGEDIVSLKHTYEPHPLATRVRRIETMTLDLTKSEADIWRGFSKTTRNEISRAERDGTGYFMGGRELLDKFFESFVDFQSRKKIPCYPPTWYRLQEVVISGTDKSWHLYLIHDAVAVLLHSISLDSKANRLNHWRDIQQFKEFGFKIYDFGGTIEGSGIGEFKCGFGSEIRPAYYQLIPLTRIGALTIKLRDLQA